jgi:hypothetical protein
MASPGAQQRGERRYLDVVDEEGIDAGKEFRGANNERQDGAEADGQIVFLLELDEAGCRYVGVGGAGGEENVDGERGRHHWMVVGGEYRGNNDNERDKRRKNIRTGA